MDKKVRVAIVLHGLGPNGIDSLFARLSSAWDYSKYDVTYFLALDKGVKTFWGDLVESNGAKIIHISDLDGKKLFFWPVRLIKALKENGPFDALHVNMDMLNGVNLLCGALAGIKTRVCHAHISANRFDMGIAKRVIKHCYLFIMRCMMAAFSTDRIACSTEAGEHFYGKGRFDVLYNGIDLQKFATSRKSSGGGHVFVTVGRITYQKNPLFLVDIFSEIVKTLPNAKLVWVGTGELENDVRAKTKELKMDDRINFLGARSDVENVLKYCDYFLFPSLFEGFGLVLVEAQAAGLDCFTSSAVPRLADCGKCKFIDKNKTAREWADEICSYVNSEGKMTLDKSKLDKFEIKNMAKELETIYQRNC